MFLSSQNDQPGFLTLVLLTKFLNLLAGRFYNCCNMCMSWYIVGHCTAGDARLHKSRIISALRLRRGNRWYIFPGTTHNTARMVYVVIKLENSVVHFFLSLFFFFLFLSRTHSNTIAASNVQPQTSRTPTVHRLPICCCCMRQHTAVYSSHRQRSIVCLLLLSGAE